VSFKRGALPSRAAVESAWTADGEARPLRDLGPVGSLPRPRLPCLTTRSPRPAGLNSAGSERDEHMVPSRVSLPSRRGRLPEVELDCLDEAALEGTAPINAERRGLARSRGAGVGG